MRSSRSDRGGDLADLKAQLADRWGALCLSLFGVPTMQTKREVRWGSKNALSVKLGGKGGPVFYSHELGQGGSLIDAVMVQQDCGFVDAVAWARDWLGGADSIPQSRPQAPTSTFDADNEEAERIASAKRLWMAGRSAPGTAAARYLAQRGIGTFPAESVRYIGARDIGRELRWWKYDCGALIVPATDASDALRGVQLIAVRDDGTPCRDEDGHKLKRSRGSLAGAAVRFPGKDTVPLFLAEGPETALSVWLATGCETWALLGGMGKAPLDGVPLGRIIAVCRDDDPPGSPAHTARRNAVRVWRRAGRRVVEAAPRSVARHDKSDFNDTLMSGGPDAVMAQLDAAIAPLFAVAAPRQSAEAARGALARQVDGALSKLLAWNKGDESKPPFLVIAVDVGLGKSEAALGATLDAWRAGRRPVYVAPTHKLNGQLSARLKAMASRRGLSPLIAVYRGAKADNPTRPGEKMCTQPALYDGATAALVPAIDTVCKVCPKREGCAFLNQHGIVADIWLAATDVIFHKPPRPMGEPDLLVIDESFVLRGVTGVEGPLLLVTRQMIEKQPQHGSGVVSRTADLVDELTGMRRKLGEILGRGGIGPLERNAMAAAGFTRDSCRQMSAAEWKRFRDPPTATLTKDEMGTWLSSARDNIEVKLMARLWAELASLAADDGPERSGRVQRWASDNGGAADSFRLVGCEPIEKRWRLPTLHIDATADMALIRARVGGRARLVGTAEAGTPHMHVSQLTGRFGQGALLDRKGRHLDRVWGWILATAREKGGRWLVVANLAVKERLTNTRDIPPFIELAHFNALRGLDSYSDVRGLIVVGRPMPRPSAMEMLRGALTGRAAPVGLGDAYYPSQTLTIMGRDGSAESVDAEIHPDPLTEAARRAVCEAELVQAIGRGRGVNRTVASPLAVYVLGNTPISGMAPNTVARWEPIGPDGEYFGRDGIQLEAPADMAGLMGERNSERLKKQRQRSGELGTNAYKKYSYANVPYFGDGARVGAYRRNRRGPGAADLKRARIAKDAGPLRDHLERAFPSDKLRAIYDPWAPGPLGAIQCQITGILNFGLAPP